MIEGILEKSHTPYFSFQDLNENKPADSVKIRVKISFAATREDIIKRVRTEREVRGRVTPEPEQDR